MILLNSPAEVLQVVTAGSQPISCNASWIDQVPGSPITFVPGQKNVVVSSPATTIVVAGPGATISRNVKEFSAYNTGVLAETVVVQVFDGTTAVTKYSVLLQPGFSIHNDDLHGWYTIDDQGRILVTAGVVIAASIDISAGTTNNLATAFSFENSNNISFGLSASTLTASAALASLNLSAGTTSNNATAFTFANSNGISFGLNNETVTASVVGVGTVTAFSQNADFVTNFLLNSPAVLSFQKVSLPMNLEATQLVFVADFSGASNSSEAVTISHAVYTLSGATARLASSASQLLSWASGSATSASSQYGGASGTRYRTLGVNYSMTPGDYLFVWWLSTANSVTAKIFGGPAVNIVGAFDGIETNYFLNGTSISSVGAFPTSIVATDTGYARTGFSALAQPGAILIGSH